MQMDSLMVKNQNLEASSLLYHLDYKLGTHHVFTNN